MEERKPGGSGGERGQVWRGEVEVEEIAIPAEKASDCVVRFGKELLMIDPALQPGFYRKEIGAKSRRRGFDALDSLEYLARRRNRGHQAWPRVETSFCRSILPLGLRGIVSIQWNTVGSMYLGRTGESRSRIIPGLSCLLLS